MRITNVALLILACLGAACTESDRSAATPGYAELVLVTGATGTQGGAVARELLDRGFDVRGLTRNPDSDRAKVLTDLGVTMVKGNFDDDASLAAAMHGAYGVFAVTDFWEHGYDKEVDHGKKLIDAAKNAGVNHFVFTSVAGSNANTGIPHFDSKAEIEEYLRESGIDYSIVRPVSFMDNFRYFRKQVMTGSFYDPRAGDKNHQWIAARDIGFFVGEAFDNPDEWSGKALDIAGDEMTIAEYADLLTVTMGLDVHHQQITWDAYEAEAGDEMTMMTRWFDQIGYDVDVESLRLRYAGLLTYEQFLINFER